MAWRIGLVVAIVLTGVPPATAADRPLFDFRGEVPVLGGTARLEVRCESAGEAVRCRAEGRGPSGRGFQAEGGFRPAPQAPAAPEPAPPAPNLPKWF